MLGVASVALWAAGCARPEPSADPISRWEFDETSSAEGFFEDRGPAHVLMIHAGTWADLTTDPLVAGDDGTSAYTDGLAYATIPADIAAYNLAAITISFYYQRESASDKHILLAAGNGSEAGDFSIEVLANGRLRAWHTGQDRVLRHFESSGGITGTNLQVGTAHRIDLTLGPQGARLYLDGAELTAAAIPENSNGWNNGRVKYLGRWTDGVQAPAVGVFDRLRIWNRQLTGAEIAELEPAQSITLPGEEPGEPGQPGDALSVPSLAEWLVSDEPDPTPTKYVSNQNRGNGSGSSPANAQEVQAALNGASPGHVLLAVCQTPGTIEFWDYRSGLSFPSGSAGNYVTLQARQGDGVVISAGEDFAGARTPNSGFWTQSGLSQDDIDKHIWRSTSTFSGGAQTMMGFWIEFDHPHQIVRASSMTILRATYGQEDSPTNYCGPCVHKDSDGRVYIRFQRPHPVKYSRDDKWSEQTWPGHPEAISSGQIAYPISQDPNDYEIYLFRDATTQGFNVGQWAKIGAGINSMGHRRSLPNGINNIWVDRGLHYNWHSFVQASDSGNNVRNCFFHRIRATDGSKLHVSRSEWKFGGWLEGIRSFWFSQFNSESASGIYCKDCTIGDYHEILVGGARCDQFRWRNCTFINIYDDGIQLPNSMSRFEIGYCYFYNSAWGGFGVSGSDGGPPLVTGQFFHHHNVIDYRQERGTNWRAQPHPGFIYGQHSPNAPQPMKIYNNLVIIGPDLEQEDTLGFAHADNHGDGGDNTLTGAANMHECFNNVILRVFLEGTKRYDPVVTNPDARYSDGGFSGRSDFAMGRQQRYSAAHSNELNDYNLYWRPAAMNVDALLRGWRRGSGQTVRDFASLAAWRASSEFEHSKAGGSFRAAYAAGFDGNSTDAKPTLPSIDDYPTSRFQYRPAPTTAVTTAASSSLSGANWWSGLGPTWGRDYFPWNDGAMTLEPSAWKGALDPNGSTMPVGVQNP
jgi:hypothetical protein